MSDIDFLLEQEKQNIEKDILEKYNGAGPTPSISCKDMGDENEKGEANETEHKEKEPDLLKKKKFDLIEDLIKLHQEAGVELTISETKLKRMTKQEIIKLIANFMNREIGGSGGEVAQTSEKGREGPQMELDPEKLHLAAEGIFMLNLALVSTLETASIKLKDKTSGIALLENWTTRVNDKKKELLIIFSMLYKDYKVEFDRYLSPAVQYAIVMLQTGATCAIENYNKKKKDTKDI